MEIPLRSDKFHGIHDKHSRMAGVFAPFFGYVVDIVWQYGRSVFDLLPSGFCCPQDSVLSSKAFVLSRLLFAVILWFSGIVLSSQGWFAFSGMVRFLRDGSFSQGWFSFSGLVLCCVRWLLVLCFKIPDAWRFYGFSISLQVCICHS